MKNIILLLVLSILTINSTKAQKKIITIRANSNQVDIREDKRLFKKAWTISPELKPDIHLTESKKITFYRPNEFNYDKCRKCDIGTQ